MAVAAKKATTKRATAKKAPAKRTSSARASTTRPAARKRATKKAQTATAAPGAGASSAAHLEPKHERTGPVLVAYRLSLSALEGVTVGVGGVALGSLGKLGLPKGAATKLTNGHAGAMRGATKASDYVGTKVAKVIGKTVGVGSRAATYVFPE